MFVRDECVAVVGSRPLDMLGVQGRGEGTTFVVVDQIPRWLICSVGCGQGWSAHL